MELSNSAIDKIGDNIRNHNRIEYHKSIKVLNAWRESHGSLLDTYYDQCVDLAAKIDAKNIIVAQRLKRLPTIIGKLYRFKDMKLSSMQDIAGVRMIVRDMKTLEKVDKKILSWPNLVKVNDYIAKPKDSGYRSKHYIFKKDNMYVEIQLRTDWQHLWATSVETVDIFRGSTLKEGGDKTYWYKFFQQVSCIFAIVEETPVLKKYKNLSLDKACQMLRHTINNYNIESKIRVFALIDPIVNNKNNDKKIYYAVIKLNTRRRVAVVYGYKEAEYHLAFKKYRKLEKVKNNSQQIVLVSVNQIKKLRQAYPNYFMDLNSFMLIIDYIIEKNNER